MVSYQKRLIKCNECGEITLGKVLGEFKKSDGRKFAYLETYCSICEKYINKYVFLGKEKR